MMKRNRIIAMLVLTLMMLSPASAMGATKLMVVSDIHYLARELYAGSDLFIRALRLGDGKLTQYGDALLAGLRGQIELERPDALLVTGDLSFNGERASHEALSKWFREIEDAGVPVWVIPGNHDINILTPRGYRGDGWYAVEGVTAEDFAAIYADFMLPATEGANLSYAAPISDALWVAMTDVAYYKDMAQTFGVFTAGHSDWLESVMADAKSKGIKLLTATHHSLIAHTEFNRDSYLMLGSDGMSALCRRYGVPLNLSGHLHIQHIARQDGLTDAALGAFCTWPHRYAVVTLSDDGRFSYEAKALNEAPLPEGLSELSRNWYLDISREKTRAMLDGAGVRAEEAEMMADYAAWFNLAYFSGLYRPDDTSWRQEPAYELWKALKGNVFWGYMDMVMNEYSGDNLRWTYD